MTLLQLFSRSNMTIGLIAYVLSTVPVLIGVFFGLDFLLVFRTPDSPMPDFLTGCARRNGVSYKEIVENGYSYDEAKQSVVAFFPVYPLLAKFVVFLTGLSPVLALVIVSNVMQVAAFGTIAEFLKARWPNAAPSERCLVLALIGVFPTTFFFRMAYAESTLLFGLAIFLNGMVRRWPFWLLAFLAGLVTAVRPVGVACTAAFLWYILFDPNGGPIRRRILLCFVYLPFALWGLLAYMGYQGVTFGNPFAFAQTQEHYSYALVAHAGFPEKIESLLSAEPIWSVYDPGSPRYWNRITFPGNALFALYFWNPIVFVGAIALIALGWSMRWLTGCETVLSMGLLAIPYLTRSYEMSMTSHGRFAAVVIPAYLVAGRIMRMLPQWAAWAVFGTFSTMLMILSAFFAAGYYLY